MHRTAFRSLSTRQQMATPDRSAVPDRFKHLLKPRSPRPDTLAKADTLPPPLALNAGLTVYTDPLDARRAAHLLRRTGFGVSPVAVQALVGMPANEAVDQIVDAAMALPLPDPPFWAQAYPPPEPVSEAEFNEYVEDNLEWTWAYREEWFRQMYEHGLREKLALFWHNHFVTQWETYFFAPMVNQYVTLMRQHALGNFKTFVYDVGLIPAMLIFLNGELNTSEEPNENFGRELLELFTMGQFDGQGQANYTQEDIQEIARALTGWWVDYGNFTARFDPFSFDNTNKTIFGQEDAFDYGDMIDLIFGERAQQVAAFICRKLYTEFIYVTPDEDLVAELADVFITNDFDLAPVVRALVQSTHFFDDQVIGAKIKSPAALLVGMLHETQVSSFVDHTFSDLNWTTAELEQEVLQPPNVAGWPGYRSWISTSTLPGRWEILDFFLYWGLQEEFISLVPLAETIHDPDASDAVFALAVALAEHFMAVPVESIGYEAPMDGFAGDLINNPIPDAIQNGPAYVRDLTKIMLGGIPWYEWDLYDAGIPWILFNYGLFLMHLPEYQLM